MIQRTTSTYVLFACAWLAPAVAGAQMAAAPAPAPAAAPAPAPAPEEETPKMNLSVAPPAPALQRTQFVHEGFYLRINVGPGVLWSNVNDKSVGNLDTSGTAFTFAADAMIGGSPGPGMALGLGVLTNTAFGVNMNDSAGITRGQNTQFHFLVGPFFDAFPNDKKGFHLGAEVGAAGAVLDAPALGNAFGGGAAAWIGYDMWVAPEWSAGFQVRGNGAYLAGDGADSSAFGLVGLITILNH